MRRKQRVLGNVPTRKGEAWDRGAHQEGKGHMGLGRMFLGFTTEGKKYSSSLERASPSSAVCLPEPVWW